MDEEKMTFVKALARELWKWQDEVTWLDVDTLSDMLAKAAAAVIGEDKEFSTITLHHEYHPADLDVPWTVITAEDEFRIILLPIDVAMLRALLLAWDENKPAEVEDPLVLPAIILGGLKVDRVTEDMLLKGGDTE
jgi:hypothetical protein